MDGSIYLAPEFGGGVAEAGWPQTVSPISPIINNFYTTMLFYELSLYVYLRHFQPLYLS